MKKATHPMQPLVFDVDGVQRFKSNPIVRFLLDAGPFDLNQLALMPFEQEDREQFAQLIGYSLSGFGELNYVSSATYGRAQSSASPVLTTTHIDGVDYGVPVSVAQEIRWLRKERESMIETGGGLWGKLHDCEAEVSRLRDKPAAGWETAEELAGDLYKCRNTLDRLRGENLALIKGRDELRVKLNKYETELVEEALVFIDGLRDDLSQCRDKLAAAWVDVDQARAKSNEYETELGQALALNDELRNDWKASQKTSDNLCEELLKCKSALEVCRFDKKWSQEQVQELRGILSRLRGDSQPHASGDECQTCHRLATKIGFPFCDQCRLEALLGVCRFNRKTWQARVQELGADVDIAETTAFLDDLHAGPARDVRRATTPLMHAFPSLSRREATVAVMRWVRERNERQRTGDDRGQEARR